MGYMFYVCDKFTGETIENWDVSNVENMFFVFYNCKSLKNTPKWYKE